MKLDHLIRPDDIITISLQNRFTDKYPYNTFPVLKNKSLLDLVNVETFRPTNHHKKTVLTEKEFDFYFPDFKNQRTMYSNIVSRNKTQLVINSKKNEYQTIAKEIKIDIKNSYLPKLSAELFYYEYCRQTNKEYTPRFSKEEHLKDMVSLYKKSPELLKDAIRQSGYIQDKSINLLFSQEMMTRTKQLSAQQNNYNERQVNTRTNELVNGHHLRSNTKRRSYAARG
jgi:hypothetical protein